MDARWEVQVREVVEGKRRFAVVQGDCTTVLPCISLAGWQVQHVLTDPPYSAHVHANVMSGLLQATGGYGRSVDLGFDRLDRATRLVVAKEVARLVERWAIFFTDVESVWKWRRVMVDQGFDYVRTGAWVRLNPAPQFSGDRPAAGFDAIAIAHRKGRKRWNGGGLPAVWTHSRNQKKERQHVTEKPVSLMLELVEQFTDRDDVVLDPFCGVGSTGIACLNAGRRFIGIERNPRYVKIARERCEAAVMNTTVEARVQKQEPLFKDQGASFKVDVESFMRP